MYTRKSPLHHYHRVRRDFLRGNAVRNKEKICKGFQGKELSEAFFGLELQAHSGYGSEFGNEKYFRFSGKTHSRNFNWDSRHEKYAVILFVC